jgi:protein-S-isoprenylcysteine O-methyltransferase Ste14
MLMALRHLLAIVLLPFVATVVVPRALLGGGAALPPGGPSRWAADRLLGLVFLALGGAVFAWCVALFARVGRGTLAPWDPTRRLVAVGPYRYVRNPMITGVLAVLIGEALVWHSATLGGWAAAFFLINHGYFLLLEEPGLERRFGEAYREYRRTVPRWLPRLSGPTSGA